MKRNYIITQLILSCFVLLLLAYSKTTFAQDGEIILGDDEIVVESTETERTQRTDDEGTNTVEEKEPKNDSDIEIKIGGKNVNLDKAIDEAIDKELKRLKIRLTRRLRRKIKQEVGLLIKIHSQNGRRVELVILRTKVKEKIQQHVDNGSTITPSKEKPLKSSDSVLDIPFIKVGNDHPFKQVLRRKKIIPISVTIASPKVKYCQLRIYARNRKTNKLFLIKLSNIKFQVRNNWAQEILLWNGNYWKTNKKKMRLPNGRYKLFVYVSYIDPFTKKPKKTGRFWGRNLNFHLTIRK